MTRDILDADTQIFLFDESRMERFRSDLQRGDRRTVGQAAIWTAFAAAYTDLPVGPERRTWLLSVIEELADRGILRLPVRHGKRWDRTSEIELPKVVTLVSDSSSVEARGEWRQFPWHSKLQWVLQLRTLGPDHIAFLKRIHEGLVEGWFDQLECFKYRSLQLTGDEKRLEGLLKGVLFRQGHLSLTMLGCEPDALPLATEQFSSDPTMLIFENAAPVMLARKALTETRSARLGRLAYGAGKQVLKAVPYFAMIEPPIQHIWYVGDLDAEGLRIAASLQSLSTSVSVRPASTFHRAMIESAAVLGFAEGWQVKENQALEIRESVLRIMAADIRSKVACIIEAGRRIPEEVLTHATMLRLLVEFPWNDS